MGSLVLEAFTFAAVMVAIYMTGWFLIATVLRRNDVVDLAWGPGFFLIAITSIIYAENYSTKALLVTGLVGIWAARLCLHIWPRLRSKTEDFRYAAWRKEWGKTVYIRSFFQVFMLQGLLMLFVGAGLIVDTLGPTTVTWLNWAGLGLWAVGFIFEVIGDHQLSAFLSQPANRGKIMTTGLWRFSRHPNYFGEITQWWGLFLIVLPSTYWYFALVSPLTITLLIVFVSGVPLLEKKFASKPGYAAYARRTSALIPWPPKK